MANPAPGFKSHPNHKILIDTGPDPVTITLDGTLVAATTMAVVLREDGYPARAYIPPADIMAGLTPTAKTTHCPFKGDTTYYSVTVGDRVLENAAWSYDAPFDEMEGIRGCVAFDDRFEIAVG
ncbi:DUF427 domain-containing protein [Acuticoccus sp. M5D2P5]|uniref:DUF427 domain-containing protein n=1 Tax=Acuticoccus kalidii TaxID=2910977 RepID=UPI001F4562D8|nr:DUF427 domain-containing protein [Acuticoccus kalidii]MCF3936411.1 DUF427 domain-containing protein [Acuticoccus kalidii]